MPALRLPGPGTQLSVLLGKQIVPGRYVARFFFFPLLPSSSELLLPFEWCSFSWGPTMILQLLWSQRRWWDLLTCNQVWPGSRRFLPQTSPVFAASPTLLGRRSARSLLRENERLQKAQEVMISFGIIAPPNSAASLEHARGPESGGSVTVRHGGFGLLIVQSSA